MGNIFDEIGTCYECYDHGVIMQNEFVTDFCTDCEKGQELAQEYAIWYAENELNEYTRERENA